MEPLEEDLEAMAAIVHRMVSVFQRRLTDHLAQFGLTVPQFVTLSALEGCEGGRRMGPLAEAALQSAASMTGIVDRLLERGLVERRRHPDDRRSVVVQLTETGCALLAAIRESRRQEWRRLLGQLSPADRQHVRVLMGTLVDSMERDIGR